MAERVDRIVCQYREGVYRGDIGETDIAYLISALLAAEQARDQAAPVLAAAENLYEATSWPDEPDARLGGDMAVDQVRDAVLAWRAAREA